MSARRRGARALGTALALGAVAACVDIATGPGGVESIRIETQAHAIIVGDTLRDSTGAATPLRALAYDGAGTVVDAPFRFLALPVLVDTTQVTNVLVVDSTSGLVRATSPRRAPLGRIAAQLGGRLQVVDTLFVVPRPTRLIRADSLGRLVPTLSFLCTDSLTARVDSLTFIDTVGTRVDTLFIGNVLPLSTLLTGDSSGVPLPVRSYYVRYEVVPPAGVTIPQVTVRGVARPAIGIVRDGTSDRTARYDTTDTRGVATAALRIFPRALGPSAFADTILPLTVRATVHRSVRDSLAPVLLSVRLRRLSRNPANDAPIACPAP